MGKACYLYCIIESKKDDNFGPIGIAQSRVYTLNYKDLCAVVSDFTDPEALEVLKEGITHQKVIEEVMKRYEVVPMSFGQVPKNQDEVKGFLIEHYDEIMGLFRKIEGKVELGIKASWRMDSVLKEIVHSNDRIRILQKQISALPEAKAYMLKLELGELVAQELKSRGEKLGDDIFNLSKPLAVDAKMNKPLSDRMLLNAAFLVAKDNEKDFDWNVNEIEKKYPQIMIKYVSSPPYNFIRLGEKHAADR